MTQIKQIKTDKISEDQPNHCNLRSIPKHWSWVKLGDVIDKISTRGIKLKQKEYLQEGKFPVVDQGKELIGGFSNDKDLLVDCELPVIVFGDHTKVKKFIDFKFIAGADGAIIIKPHKVWDAKLFYYFLHCVKFPDKGYARHFQFVEKAVIPLPPLPEQKKIVDKIEELFSSLDSGVASLKKAKEQIRLYRQSVLAAAFSGRLTRKDDISSRDVIFSSKAAEPKPEYSNQLPDGWKWVKLGEVAKFSQGIQVPVENQKMKSFIGGVRFLRIIDFTQGNQEERYIKDPGEKYKVNRTDLSMVRYGASTGFICRGLEGVIANNLFRILPSNKINKANLFYFFKSPLFQEKLESSLKGAAMPAISFNFLNNLLFPLAPLNKQTQIVEEIEKRFSEAGNLEKAIDDSLAKAETLRQSILKKAFEGRLV